MTDLSLVHQAEAELLRLRHTYDKEGEPIEPRELRYTLESLRRQLELDEVLLMKLCSAMVDLNSQMAEKHGISAVIPF
jgi:hypothetical protein